MTCSIEFSLAGLLWISVYALVGGALLGVSEAIAANLLKAWGQAKRRAD